jgi:hypothetical protein
MTAQIFYLHNDNVSLSILWRGLNENIGIDRLRWPFVGKLY